MKKILILIIFSIALLFLSTSITASTYDIDRESLSKGILGITVNTTLDKIYKIRFIKDEKMYTYTAKNNKKDFFPLTMGNGEYELIIYENTTGNSYRKVVSENVTLNVINENDIYINSMQLVEFSDDMKSIQFIDTLVYNTATDLMKTMKIYEHLIFNYNYDYDKNEQIKNKIILYYCPVIDDTYTTRQGICYDFSSLLAASLRSKGIPTKLIMGQTSYMDSYHAWNEVYINNEWYVIDITHDAYYIKKDYEVIMFKKTSEYSVVYEY